jgi:hypothetical protein
VALDFHRLSPDRIAALLERAGLDVRASAVRKIEEGEGVAPVPQAYLLARKPAAST